LVRLSLNQNQDWDKLRKSYSGGMVWLKSFCAHWLLF
jgi:hypothetical protein